MRLWEYDGLFILSGFNHLLVRLISAYNVVKNFECIHFFSDYMAGS